MRGLSSQAGPVASSITSAGSGGAAAGAAAAPGSGPKSYRVASGAWLAQPPSRAVARASAVRLR